jgi:hypothetical protein
MKTKNLEHFSSLLKIPLFQNYKTFDFSSFIAFAMQLDIVYV